MKTICVDIDGTIGKVLPHCAESLQELKRKDWFILIGRIKSERT